MAGATVHIKMTEVEPVVELIRLAGAVARAWRRLGDCEDEFMPDYPDACCEYRDALDTAIIAMMRHIGMPEAEGTFPRPEANPRLKDRG